MSVGGGCQSAQGFLGSLLVVLSSPGIDHDSGMLQAGEHASFSNLKYATKKKVTRCDRFLGEIDARMPSTTSNAIRGFVVGIDLIPGGRAGRHHAAQVPQVA